MKYKSLTVGICSVLLIAATITSSALAIKGSGKTATETRKLSAYHTVMIKLPAEFTAEAGKTNEVSIEADDNLLPHIKTTVENGELKIEADQSFSNSHKLSIKAKAADLDGFSSSGAVTATINNPAKSKLTVDSEGASNITVNNLAGGKFALELKGASSLTATGQVESLNAKIQGTGSLKAVSLSAKSATVAVNGAGSAEVNAEKNLTVSIAGVGSVKYKGNPKVTKQISGLGSIKQI